MSSSRSRSRKLVFAETLLTSTNVEDLLAAVVKRIYLSSWSRSWKLVLAET